MEHLPLEIFFLILREVLPPIYKLEPDKRWLVAMWQKKNIVRVCKSWYWAATPLLYESVIIHRIYQLPLLVQAVEKSPGNLAGHIRELNLSFSVGTPLQHLFEDHICRLFAISSNLSFLSFPIVEGSLQTLRTLPPFITHITLEQRLPYETMEEILTPCSRRLISLRVYLPAFGPSDPSETNMEFERLEELICSLNSTAHLSHLVDRDWKLPKLRKLTFQSTFDDWHDPELDQRNPIEVFCGKYGHGIERLCINLDPGPEAFDGGSFARVIRKLDLSNLPSLETLVTRPRLSRTETFFHPSVKNIHTSYISPPVRTPSTTRFYTEDWNASAISKIRERFPALTKVFEWSSNSSTSSSIPGHLPFEQRVWSETPLFAHWSPGFTIIATELTESPLDREVLPRRDLEDCVAFRPASYKHIPVPRNNQEDVNPCLPPLPDHILGLIFEWAIPPPSILDALTHPLVLNSLQFWVAAQKKAIVNVCKSWNRVGTPLFYQHVCITRPHQLVMLLQVLETASRPLKQLIKMLYISSYIPDTLHIEFHTQVKQILSVCPNLSSFSYAPPLGYSNLPVPKFAPNDLPPLTHFKFRFNQIPRSILEPTLIQLDSSLVSLSLFIPTGLYIHRPTVFFSRLRELTFHFNSAQDLSGLSHCNWSFPVLRRLTLWQTSPFESTDKLEQSNRRVVNEMSHLVWFCDMHAQTIKELRLYPGFFFWQSDLQGVITALPHLEKLVLPDTRLTQGLMHPNVLKIVLFQRLTPFWSFVNKDYGLNTPREVVEFARIRKLGFPFLKILHVFFPIGILPVEMLDHMPPDDMVITNPHISYRYMDLDIVVIEWPKWPSTPFQLDYLRQPLEDEESNSKGTALVHDRAEENEEDSDSTYVFSEDSEESESDVSSGDDEGPDPLRDI